MRRVFGWIVTAFGCCLALVLAGLLAGIVSAFADPKHVPPEPSFVYWIALAVAAMVAGSFILGARLRAKSER